MKTISIKSMRKLWIAIYRHIILFQKFYNIQTLRHNFWCVLQHNLAPLVLNFLCKAGWPHASDSWRERKYTSMKDILWASLLAKCVILLSHVIFTTMHKWVKAMRRQTPFLHARLKTKQLPILTPSTLSSGFQGTLSFTLLIHGHCLEHNKY